MKDNGSPPPEFESDEDRTYLLIRLPIHERTPQVTPHVTPHVKRLMTIVDGELRRDELQERLGITERSRFRTAFLAPAMEAGLLRPNGIRSCAVRPTFHSRSKARHG